MSKILGVQSYLMESILATGCAVLHGSCQEVVGRGVLHPAVQLALVLRGD